MARGRGVHGEMNRKFADVPLDDPAYETVERIKGIIAAPDVDVVLNLHDGSGYYRPRHLDGRHNPHRWGQSVIIDQARAPVGRFGDLGGIAEGVVAAVNREVLRPEHAFHVKNTRTADGNADMAKTLTFFALRNGKAAFGLEATKDLLTHRRAYYHLRAVEAFMDRMGIAYERDFPLTPEGVRRAIRGNLDLALYGNRFLIDLTNVRNRLGYVPMEPRTAVRYAATNPLVAITSRGGDLQVHYGNRRLTRLHPQYFEYDHSLERITLRVDGHRREVPLGSRVPVREDFRVEPMPDYRVNVIGWTGGKGGDESGHLVRRSAIPERFSIDEDGRLFRVEVYRDGRFAGMVLVDFASGREHKRVAANPWVRHQGQGPVPRADTAGR